MPVARTTIPSSSRQRLSVPPLENGDRLTRAEFERRYEAMPQIKKAELIEGIVYVEYRVRAQAHGRPLAVLTGWLGQYVAKTPVLQVYGSHATVRLDWDNEFQPDLFLNLPMRMGCLAEIDADDFISGPPTLVCEVAASSVSVDLHSKLNVYRRNQVREYLVWRTEDRAVDWLVWREGQYVALAADEKGVIKSEQFPGLWLDTLALIEGKLPALFKGVDDGTATAEHAKFVERLRGA